MAVIQIVKFSVNDGVDDAAFRALNERFQREVAPALPGLERREATVSEDGEWLLVLRYTDMESAHKAGRSDTGDISRAFMQMINMNSLSV
ncbi:MAG: hypothetical protein L0287_01510, partial [Anaerolineae bacterium]|nr:hypothetical protein [Anaerolineae bacterium]